MKVFTYILLGIFLTFLVTVSAYADSSSTTTIINNSSNNQSSSSNCHTSIHMETNGQVQDYNSDNCGNVNMQSNNGNNSVRISNNSNSNNNITPFPTQPPVFKALPTIVTSTMPPTPTLAIHKEQIKDFHKKLIQQKNFIDKLRTWIQSFFAAFHF